MGRSSSGSGSVEGDEGRRCEGSGLVLRGLRGIGEEGGGGGGEGGEPGERDLARCSFNGARPCGYSECVFLARGSRCEGQGLCQIQLKINVRN